MTTRVKRKTKTAPPKPGGFDLASLGRRIRELRGFDTQQAEFAKMLGVSQSILSKYERGAIAPPIEVLVRLSERFGKSLDWLVLGKE